MTIYFTYEIWERQKWHQKTDVQITINVSLVVMYKIILQSIIMSGFVTNLSL